MTETIIILAFIFSPWIGLLIGHAIDDWDNP